MFTFAGGTASRTGLLRKARLGHRRYIVLRSLFMRSKQQSLAPRGPHSRCMRDVAMKCNMVVAGQCSAQWLLCG
ncbi:hypothetical protein KC367_g254 [Hortaea werneckii]|nr:hypothetical protein KC367_g254 [Hortaea werneckii]